MEEKLIELGLGVIGGVASLFGKKKKEKRYRQAIEEAQRKAEAQRRERIQKGEEYIGKLKSLEKEIEDVAKQGIERIGKSYEAMATGIKEGLASYIKTYEQMIGEQISNIEDLYGSIQEQAINNFLEKQNKLAQEFESAYEATEYEAKKKALRAMDKIPLGGASFLLQSQIIQQALEPLITDYIAKQAQLESDLQSFVLGVEKDKAAQILQATSKKFDIADKQFETNRILAEIPVQAALAQQQILSDLYKTKAQIEGDIGGIIAQIYEPVSVGVPPPPSSLGEDIANIITGIASGIADIFGGDGK